MWVSRACECQETEREERRLAAAHIPERYRQYTLDGYETAFRGADASLGRAHLTARRFVEAYPVDTAGKGCCSPGRSGLARRTWRLECCDDWCRNEAPEDFSVTIVSC